MISAFSFRAEFENPYAKIWYDFNYEKNVKYVLLNMEFHCFM